jgi:hypothetical protein
MQVMARESWTDERLDDLNEKVARGFEQVDKRFERVEDEFKAVRQEMKEGFDKMDLRFDSLQRSYLYTVVALFGGMFTAFAGLIATQL